MMTGYLQQGKQATMNDIYFSSALSIAFGLWCGGFSKGKDFVSSFMGRGERIIVHRIGSSVEKVARNSLDLAKSGRFGG